MTSLPSKNTLALASSCFISIFIVLNISKTFGSSVGLIRFSTQLKAIEKAIIASDIGITPTNDGKALRLAFPQPTEDRRKELVKQVKKYGEEAKVTLRNIRRDTLEKFKTMKKNNEITEDDMKGYEKDIQKLTDKFCDEVDKVVADKEKEIMSI